MWRLALIALATALLVTGCGGGDEGAGTTDTVTTTPPVETTKLRVYWLREGEVWPALREVEDTTAVAQAALGQLYAGPTEQEETELGFSSAIPDDDTILDSLSISDGVAVYGSSVEFTTEEARAQVVYTLTQFPSIESVEIDGKTYTRADFEDMTPSILVESPLPFEEVESPLRVTGTANTFEATFQSELTDTDGRIVDESFVTATSGSGERGTFDFTTDEYTVPFDGVGSLIVFESSAEDGSRIHLFEIPLRMTR